MLAHSPRSTRRHAAGSRRRPRICCDPHLEHVPLELGKVLNFADDDRPRLLYRDRFASVVAVQAKEADRGRPDRAEGVRRAGDRAGQSPLPTPPMFGRWTGGPSSAAPTAQRSMPARRVATPAAEVRTAFMVRPPTPPSPTPAPSWTRGLALMVIGADRIEADVLPLTTQVPRIDAGRPTPPGDSEEPLPCARSR